MTLDRRELVHALLAERPPHLAVVSSLGSPTWDVAAAGNDPSNFGFIGAMGQAAPFALGLALASPGRRVVLFCGDGELLMSLGALATAAGQAPSNLAIVVLDNQSYGETGGQPTATAGPADLEAIARGCGFAQTQTVAAESELDGLRAFMLEAPGPALAVARIAQDEHPLAFPYSFDGVTAVNRFRRAILGDDGEG